MRIVRRRRIRNDISSLALFASVANNDISLFGTRNVKFCQGLPQKFLSFYRRTLGVRYFMFSTILSNYIRFTLIYRSLPSLAKPCDAIFPKFLCFARKILINRDFIPSNEEILYRPMRLLRKFS